jgi:hypothetical protein
MTEHSFSVQLKSKEFLTNITVSGRSGEPVLLEGVLGEFVDIEVIEEAVLRFTGTKGTLMVDLSNEKSPNWEIHIKNKQTVNARKSLQREYQEKDTLQKVIF